MHNPLNLIASNWRFDKDEFHAFVKAAPDNYGAYQDGDGRWWISNWDVDKLINAFRASPQAVDAKHLIKLHEAGGILTETHLAIDKLELEAAQDEDTRELIAKSKATILALRDFEETFQRLSIKYKST